MFRRCYNESSRYANDYQLGKSQQSLQQKSTAVWVRSVVIVNIPNSKALPSSRI